MIAQLLKLLLAALIVVNIMVWSGYLLLLVYVKALELRTRWLEGKNRRLMVSNLLLEAEIICKENNRD